MAECTVASILLVVLSTCGVHSVYGETGAFWHVTDFHYDHTYGTTGLSCNEKVPMTSYYGNYWCDSPWPLVEDSIKNMARLFPNPDFIIWTGDNVGHIKDANLTLEVNLEILQNITTALTDAFPNIPVHATLGNHDFWPSDQADVREVEFYRRVADMWAHWINDTAQKELFKKGGYFSKDVSHYLKLINLNTNLYYSKNKLTANMTDPAGQLKWLNKELFAVKAAGKKAMLTGHVTIGLLTPGLVDWLHPRFRKPIIDIVTAHSDVITASHFGHDHHDNFKLLQDKEHVRAITHFSAPSVTPWRFKIPGKTGAAHNPGIRLIKYDRKTAANLDYDQYFINLTDSNVKNHTDWTKLYSFTEAYDVRDMSVDSMRKVFDKMQESDSIYAKKYCQYALVSSYPQECTARMHADTLCGGLYHNKDRAKVCVDKFLSGDARAQYGGWIHALFVVVVSFVSRTIAVFND